MTIIEKIEQQFNSKQIRKKKDIIESRNSKQRGFAYKNIVILMKD